MTNTYPVFSLFKKYCVILSCTILHKLLMPVRMCCLFICTAVGLTVIWTFRCEQFGVFWCNSFVTLDAPRQCSTEDMLCAQEAHVFKPFGRQYCTMHHPGYCSIERTLPTSDCPTISTAAPSLRTLKEDASGDRSKVITTSAILVRNWWGTYTVHSLWHFDDEVWW